MGARHRPQAAKDGLRLQTVVQCTAWCAGLGVHTLTVAPGHGAIFSVFSMAFSVLKIVQPINEASIPCLTTSFFQ
jgi:hypothetical protein